MSQRIATFGSKFGTCNICGEIGRLTDDHTPPKGCIKPTRVELRHIGQLLSSESPKEPGRISQNGVKYRTICHRCNNTLLGSKYDPALISFVNCVSSILKDASDLPQSISISAQPQAILRSLLGHISAQGVDRYRKGQHTETLRDYFLDTSLALPSALKAYYWIYPYKSHVMARDAVFIDIPSNSEFLFWLLKFYPMAFFITWEEAPGVKLIPQSFEPWRGSPYSTICEVPLFLYHRVHQYWPEAPSDRHVLLFGEEAISVNA